MLENSYSYNDKQVKETDLFDVWSLNTPVAIWPCSIMAESTECINNSQSTYWHPQGWEMGHLFFWKRP